jgi:hypothetical protein
MVYSGHKDGRGCSMERTAFDLMIQISSNGAPIYPIYSKATRWCSNGSCGSNLIVHRRAAAAMCLCLLALSSLTWRSSPAITGWPSSPDEHLCSKLALRCCYSFGPPPVAAEQHVQDPSGHHRFHPARCPWELPWCTGWGACRWRRDTIAWGRPALRELLAYTAMAKPELTSFLTSARPRHLQSTLALRRIDQLTGMLLEDAATPAVTVPQRCCPDGWVEPVDPLVL